MDWWDAEQYDLVLNTERVCIDECVDTVLHYVRHPDFQETSESHAKFDNMRLESRIRSALRQNPPTHTTRIAITADGGRVKLEGVVDTPSEKRAVADVAASVAGVSDVRNDLTVLSEQRSHHREG